MKPTRQRPRSSERGAALFIVVLVVVLISAIGIFAVRSASLVDVAAGYSRKAAQTLYVTEFATRLVTADMSGQEDLYFNRISNTVSNCRSTQDLVAKTATNTPIPCYAVEKNEMEQRIRNVYAATADDNDFVGRIVRPGLAAAGAIDAQAAFRVELSDLGPAPRNVVGEDLKQSNFKFHQVALTATGQVRPVTASGACSADTMQAAGVQSIRAYVTFMASQ
jgi:hypothetical protein